MKRIIAIVLVSLLTISFLSFAGAILIYGNEITEKLLGPEIAELLAVDPNKCRHRYVDGVCSRCGQECAHDWDENGTCRICKVTCKHDGYESGHCDKCGLSCDHEWKNGVCSVCGFACRHPSHGVKDHLCDFCGKLVTHQYVSGRCAVCGSTPKFYYTDLPDRFYTPCDEAGQTFKIQYSSKTVSTGEKLTRTASIYLPYGYDENKQYNVLIMVHGLGGNSNQMINQTYSYDNRDYNLKYLYDHMIKERLCEPFIGVGINTRGGASDEELYYEQIAYELKNDLLPYIVRHFGTYAEGDTLEDIVAARRHFGMCGLSMGSIYTYKTGLELCLDIFGNFGPFGGAYNYEPVVTGMNTGRSAEMPIYCLVAGCGTQDGSGRLHYEAHQYILKRCSTRLRTGINCWYLSPDYGHEYRAFHILMYDGLQVMFQDLE